MTTKKKFKIWWDEKEGILRNKIWGDVDDQDGQKIIDAYDDAVKKQPGRVLFLHDLTEPHKASSGARKKCAQLLRNENVKKNAFYGMNTATRVTVSFIVRFAGVKNAKFSRRKKIPRHGLKSHHEYE
jgi:hypothetical protein